MSHPTRLSQKIGLPAETGQRERSFGIYLYWIPLGAGGSGFVRMNGRIYETAKALIARRRPLDLYHTALEVRIPEGRFIVETMWPSPDNNPKARGVAVTGPVFARWMSFTRIFRYEVRCWQDGVLPDADHAINGPQLLSDDLEVARRVVDLVGAVPSSTWGRDESAVGDMWNSNSVIAWLLTRSGLPVERFESPAKGRAPGWKAGIALALEDRAAANRDVAHRGAR